MTDSVKHNTQILCPDCNGVEEVNCIKSWCGLIVLGIGMTILGALGISRMAVEKDHKITDISIVIFVIGVWIIYFKIKSGYREKCCKCRGTGYIKLSEVHNINVDAHKANTLDEE